MAHGAVHTLAAVHGKASALLGNGSVFVKNCSSETRGGTTCCHHDDIALFRKFQRLLKLRPVGLIEAGTIAYSTETPSGASFFIPERTVTQELSGIGGV